MAGERRPQRPARQPVGASRRRGRLGAPDAVRQLGTRRQRAGRTGGRGRRARHAGRGSLGRAAQHELRQSVQAREDRDAGQVGRDAGAVHEHGPDPGRERALDVRARRRRRRATRAAASTPASASPRAKIAGVGLGRAELGGRDRAVDQRAPGPASASRSCSDASQLETTTSAHPPARSARSAGGTSGYAVKRDRVEQRRGQRAGRARRRAAGPSAGRIASAERARRSASDAASRPSCRCAR